jgi:hypothetical protein
MIYIIIISSYILSVFVVRYFDIKWCWLEYGTAYKDELKRTLWLIPVINLFVCIKHINIYYSREFMYTHSRSWGWFFQSKHYISKFEEEYRKEFLKYLNENGEKETRTITAI